MGLQCEMSQTLGNFNPMSGLEFRLFESHDQIFMQVIPLMPRPFLRKQAETSNNDNSQCNDQAAACMYTYRL